MPNHVTTRCVVVGPSHDVQRFRALAFQPDKEGVKFDFNAIIPMPEGLAEMVTGSEPEMGAALIIARGTHKHGFGLGADDLGLGRVHIDRIRADVNMPHDHLYEVAAAYLSAHLEVERAGKEMLRLIVETGYASWYPWSIDHWGTKWGAYRLSVLDDAPLTFKFETAWSFPTPVFEKLGTDFPTLTFECACYDEGSNFAGSGGFGATDTPFQITAATDALYELVHGHAPQREEEESQ